MKRRVEVEGSLYVNNAMLYPNCRCVIVMAEANHKSDGDVLDQVAELMRDIEKEQEPTKQ